MGWGSARAQETRKRFAVDPGLHRQGLTSGKGWSWGQNSEARKGMFERFRASEVAHPQPVPRAAAQSRGRDPSRAAIPAVEPGMPGMLRPCLRALTHWDSCRKCSSRHLPTRNTSRKLEQGWGVDLSQRRAEPRGCQHPQGTWAPLQGWRHQHSQSCSATALLSALFTHFWIQKPFQKTSNFCSKWNGANGFTGQTHRFGFWKQISLQ